MNIQIAQIWKEKVLKNTKKVIQINIEVNIVLTWLKTLVILHFTEENFDILKNDSENLCEQLVENSDINECIKSEIDGKIENELVVSNDNYM